jgi:Tol biopolymer transport system component
MLLLLLVAGAAHAAFPGKNGAIAFEDESGQAKLKKINSDGTGEADVSPEQPAGRKPAWSPDGSKIVFTRSSGAPNFFTEIWVENADGTGQVQLTEGNQDQRPAFSGDGTKIVFVRDFDAIWVMNADGTDPHSVLALPPDQEASGPVFSPDSTKIAFTHNVFSPSFSIRIAVVNADGSGLVDLTPADEFGTDPDFSPNGQTLVYSRCSQGSEGCDVSWHIATIPVTGGAVTQVSFPPAFFDDFAPVYSPDGTQIAFYREEQQVISRAASARAAGDTVLHVMSATGAGVHAIGGSSASFPDWQPLAGGGGGGTAGKKGNSKLCRGVPVTIRTTNHDDVIIGTPGRDVVHGQGGDDIIRGMGGNDRLCGGRDKDHVYGGSGNDIIFGGDQIDFLFGQSGIDKIFGGTPDAPVHLFKDHCSGGRGHDSFRNCQRHKGFNKKFPQP